MQSQTTISYKIIASGYKDYVKLMLGDTQIAYVKTTKETFPFVEQELRHMVDAINVLPTVVMSLKKLRGIEAWIIPSERKLAKPIYDGIEAYEETSFAKYVNGGQ